MFYSFGVTILNEVPNLISIHFFRMIEFSFTLWIANIKFEKPQNVFLCGAFLQNIFVQKII